MIQLLLLLAAPAGCIVVIGSMMEKRFACTVTDHDNDHDTAVSQSPVNVCLGASFAL